MIEPKLAFLQVQIESCFRDAMKLLQPSFREGPEGFNAIDMVCSSGELSLAVSNSVMSLVSQVHKPIIASILIRKDFTFLINFSLNDRVDHLARAIGDYLCINSATTFKNTEHDGFSASSTPDNTSHTSRPEIRFIHLDLAKKGRFLFARSGHSHSQQPEVSIDRIPVELGHSRHALGIDIQRKKAHKLPKLLLRNSGTVDILITCCHN